MAEIEKEETMAAEEVVETVTEAQETPIAEPEVPASDKKANKTKKKNKNAKPNFFVRLGRRLAKFFRDYNSERKKITWKPWREVCKSSAVVVVSVLVFSAIILGIDTVFDSLFKWIAGLI